MKTKRIGKTNSRESVTSSNDFNFFILGAGLLLFILYVYAAGLALSIENQLFLSLTILVLLFLLRWTQPYVGDFNRIALVTLSAYLSLRYWFFRTTLTLTYTGFWDFIFLILLYVAETHGIFTHLMGMLVNISPLQRTPAPLPKDSRRLPTVDVFIPTYNESPEILETTASACAQLIYPHEKLNIFILDDGGTDQKLKDTNPKKAAFAKKRAEELQHVAKRLGIHYVTREKNVHAKAGNINALLMDSDCEESHENAIIRKNGAPISRGELILILDCDHVPTKDFLQNTVGFFLEDEKLAFVQTPHFFINPTPVEKNLETHKLSPAENEMFYGGVHLGLDFWNSSFFCGSAAVLRRKHLRDIGGLSSNTITEDAATALKLHSKGLNSIYLNKPMAVGLSPDAFDGFIIQRSRWAKGMTQILLLKNPLFLKGLSIPQRICYLNACLYWLFGLARMIFFLSPLMFLFFGLRVYNASIIQVLAYAVPHLIASYYVSNFLYGKLRHPFFSELFETIQSIFLAPAVLSVFLRPRAPKFKVTPKSISLEKDYLTHLSTPFYIMLLLAGLAYPVAAVRYLSNPTLYDTIIICVIWNTFNLLLMLCCLGVVWESKQVRKAHRFYVKEKVTIIDPLNDSTTEATMINLSAAGLCMFANLDDDNTSKNVILSAADSYGKQYKLPIQILRSSPHPAGKLYGCRFDITNKKIQQQVIGFVYGDSRRLKYFHQAQTERTLNSFRGFFNLNIIGLRGTFRNVRGLLRICWRNIAMIVSRNVFHLNDQRRISTS